MEGVFLPFFKINNEEVHINEDGIKMYPSIWMDLFSDDYMYFEDNNFPIIYNDSKFFPFVSFRCRESLFLLEFLVPLIENNKDWLVCNVNNKLLSSIELSRFLSEKNYGWSY